MVTTTLGLDKELTTVHQVTLPDVTTQHGHNIDWHSRRTQKRKRGHKITTTLVWYNECSQRKKERLVYYRVLNKDCQFWLCNCNTVPTLKAEVKSFLEMLHLALSFQDTHSLANNVMCQGNMRDILSICFIRAYGQPQRWFYLKKLLNFNWLEISC